MAYVMKRHVLQRHAPKTQINRATFGLNVPSPRDAEVVLRDLLPEVAPNIDPDRAVENVLSSMISIINICIAAKAEPDVERILASVIHSFLTPAPLSEGR